MLRTRKRRARTVKPKAVKVELIERESEIGTFVYGLVERYIERHHEHLVDARIAVAWSTGWTPDRDGIITLGQCRKASDLDRELHAYDLVILVFKPYWFDEFTTDEDREWLIDHELTHAEILTDATTGEPVYDERQRKCYRIRKHDFEEFYEVMDRHPQSRRAQTFVKRLKVLQRQAFKACEKVTEDGACAAGWFTYSREIPTPIEGVSIGKGSCVRCECWNDYHALQATAREVLSA